MTQSERPWSPGHTNKENQDFYLTECRKWATQANWFRWTKYLNNPNKRNGNFPWKNFRKQACSSGQQQKANFFLKYQIKWTLDLYLCVCKSKSTPDDQNNTNKRLLQPDRYQREREREYQNNNPTVEVLLLVLMKPKGEGDLEGIRGQWEDLIAPMSAEAINAEALFALLITVNPNDTHRKKLCKQWIVTEKICVNPMNFHRINCIHPINLHRKKPCTPNRFFTENTCVYPMNCQRENPVYRIVFSTI